MQKIRQLLGIMDRKEKQHTEQVMASVEEAMREAARRVTDPNNPQEKPLPRIVKITERIAEQVNHLGGNISKIVNQMEQIQQINEGVISFNGESSNRTGTSRTSPPFPNDDDPVVDMKVGKVNSEEVSNPVDELTDIRSTAEIMTTLDGQVKEVRTIVSDRYDTDGNRTSVGSYSKTRVAIANVSEMKKTIIEKNGMLKELQCELPKVVQNGLCNFLQKQLPDILQTGLNDTLMDPLNQILPNYEPTTLRKKILSGLFGIKPTSAKLIRTLQKELLKILSKELQDMFKEPLLVTLQSGLVDTLKNKPLPLLPQELHVTLENQLLEILKSDTRPPSPPSLFTGLREKLRDKCIEVLRDEDILDQFPRDSLEPFVNGLRISIKNRLFTALWTPLLATLQKWLRKLPEALQSQFANWHSLLHTLNVAKTHWESIEKTLEFIETYIYGNEEAEIGIRSRLNQLMENMHKLQETSGILDRTKNQSDVANATIRRQFKKETKNACLSAIYLRDQATKHLDKNTLLEFVKRLQEQAITVSISLNNLKDKLQPFKNR
jgi:hypothetical protein